MTNRTPKPFPEKLHHPNILQVGITGNMGSGKSIISRIFKEWGVPFFDADIEAKNLYYTDLALKEEVIKTFGIEAYLSDGQLNRAYLASKVFNNPDELKKLNNLNHPAVAKAYQIWLQGQISTQKPLILKEAALLIEAKTYLALDIIILVRCPDEVRLQRVLERDTQRTHAEVLNIFKRQLSEEEKLPFAHYTIANSGKEAILPQVEAIFQDLLKFKKSIHQ